MISIGLTDQDWFEWCRTHLTGGELNYWTPTPWRIRKLKRGDRWYFLLKDFYPKRLIGGFGYFLRYEELSLQQAWQVFGIRNGCSSFETFIERLGKYPAKRSASGSVTKTSTIGCVVLGGFEFFEDIDFLDLETCGIEFPRQIVKFKYFDIDPILAPLSLHHYRDVTSVTTEGSAVDTTGVFTERPASTNTDHVPLEGAEGVAVQVDYDRRGRENARLGREGERYVADVERSRLAKAGRADLAEKVEWVANTQGDGLGYDISSFETNGCVRLIEVKTTTGPADTRFYLTDGEVRCSRRHPREYWLYRVFDWKRSKKIWTVAGPLDQAFRLTPVSYRAEP